MEIIGIQFDLAWEAPAANRQSVVRLLGSADIRRPALVVLPEMFASGFSMDVGSVAEPAGGETEAFLAALARKHGVCVLGGVATQGAVGKGRNEAVGFDGDGREVARYCKRHPFSLAGETDHYEPGDDIVVFTCGEFMVAPFMRDAGERL